MFGGTVNEETFYHSKEYFFWISLGIPFYMFGQAMNPVIRADGSPKFAMASTLAGAVVNIILDPIFIFVFQLLLPLFYGLDGVLYSMPVSDVLTFIVSVIVIAATYKQLNADM